MAREFAFEGNLASREPGNVSGRFGYIQDGQQRLGVLGSFEPKTGQIATIGLGDQPFFK